MIDYRKKLLITTSTLLLAGQLHLALADDMTPSQCTHYLDAYTTNHNQSALPDDFTDSTNNLSLIAQCQALCDQYPLISDGSSDTETYTSNSCSNLFASMDYMAHYQNISAITPSGQESTQLGSVNPEPRTYSSPAPVQTTAPTVAMRTPPTTPTTAVNTTPPPPTTSQEKKQSAIRWL